MSLQRQRYTWPKGRQIVDDRSAHGRRHILQQLRHCSWLEICKLNLTLFAKSESAAPELNFAWLQEMAFEASQKYKEGKFIIEKARLLKVGPALALPTCSILLVTVADDQMYCTGGQLVAMHGVE